MELLRFLGVWADPLEVGDVVRIRQSINAPLAGSTGRIIDIAPSDPFGGYLVKFADGLQFRYHEEDLCGVLQTGSALGPGGGHEPLTLGSVFMSQVRFVFLLVRSIGHGGSLRG